MISVRFQDKPFNIMVIQVYAPTNNAEEAEVEWFYEDLQDLLELTPKKDVQLVIANTLFQQHKRRLYVWISPDGQQRNLIDYILCSQRWRSSIQSAKTRPGADYGSDHELNIAKFRLKLKKVGKTTRPFRYDLNQIPYDYTVEVQIDSRD